MTLALSEHQHREYESTVNELVRIITTDPTQAQQRFNTAYQLAQLLIPEQPQNTVVLEAVRMMSRALPFTLTEFKRAMEKWRTEWRKQERLAAKQERITQALGVDPRNSREYVAAFMAMRGVDVGYDRQWTAHDEPTKALDVINDAVLTADDIGLLPKLSARLITRAVEEWGEQRRTQRRDAVIERLLTLSDGRDKATLEAQFKQTCAWYFEDTTDFSSCAVMHVMWATKRKALGLPVPQPLMVVITGPQNLGKSEVCRAIMRPVSELAAEAALTDIIDPRQLHLPEMYLLLCDELTSADRADVAALKSYLTSTTQARRPLFTNISEKIRINTTLIGTSNNKLDTLVYDHTGMRRFIEVYCRKIRSDVEPHWQAIMDADWLGFWQMVDPYAEDPMQRFEYQLRQRQEALRNPNNVELWASTFVFDKNTHECKFDTSNNEYTEFFAEPLYQVFKLWEQEYDRAYRGTSLARWGRDMKALIEQGRLPDWSHRTVGNKVVYRQRRGVDITPGSVVPFDAIKAKLAKMRKADI